MTGFSSKSASIEIPSSGKISFFIEMKSINSRFFEVVTKMPSALNSLDIKVSSRLQKKLRRGRVYVNIRFAEDNEAFGEIEPSLKIAKGYVSAAKKIEEACGISGELSVRHLFQLPNIFVTKKSAITPEQAAAILQVIDQAADQLFLTRQEEGAELQKDIEKRFVVCGEKMEEVAGLYVILMDSVKKKIDDKLVLVEKGDELAKRQLEDLYSTLNKVDVHEEITRFKSHLQSVITLLKKEGMDKGKRLDFILQELLRETNTTMAKCTNFAISSVCVDIKVELEKAREQVQNIL